MGLSATQRAAGAAGSVPPWLPEVILSGLVTAFGGYGRAARRRGAASACRHTPASECIACASTGHLA